MLIQPLTPEILEKRRVFRRKMLGLPRRFWRKTRRGIGWTLAIGFALHCALNIYASVLLNRELSAIRQKGEPLQFAEMAPPKVPDSQNAALVYKAATQSLHFSSDQKVAFHTRERKRTPQMKRDIEAALEENQKSLDLTRRAASMNKCRFPLDYQTHHPTALFFSYYEEMRELARLMQLQASSEAKKGDTRAALRDVRAMFVMAHHLSSEPVYIGFLVAQGIDILANTALAQVLESARLSQRQAQEFQTSLPHSDWNRAFRHCMMGERSWEIFVFEMLRRPSGLTFTAELFGSRNSTNFWFYPVHLLWRPFLKLDELQTLRLWNSLLSSPVYQEVPRPADVRADLDGEIEKMPRYAVLTRTLFPVFTGASDQRDFAEVRRRQREIALALTTYRTQKGAYPAQLSEVVAWRQSPLPLDPYSQKPFLYRLEGKTFLLYSIGVNRVDNGGENMVRQPRIGQNWVSYDDFVWGNVRNGWIHNF